MCVSVVEMPILWDNTSSVLCCLAMQLQTLGIGVTTKDPDSGLVPGLGSDDQCWFVIIWSGSCKAWQSGACTAWHKGRELQWVLDRSAGNTFGCHVSGTGELHLHHNGRDVGVALEGLPTDQPLWGFVILDGGWKVEASYVIAQSEAVCVLVCMSIQLATEVEGIHLHVYSFIYILLCNHSFHVTVNCCSLALLGTCMLYTSCRPPPGL